MAGHEYTSWANASVELEVCILFCSVLFCSVLFCSVLFCSVLFCSVLFCSVLFCSVLPQKGEGAERGVSSVSSATNIDLEIV